jgi:monoamine oxidase
MHMRGWRSPATAALRRRLAAEERAERTGEPAEELLGALADRRARMARDADGPTRRQLLTGAGVAGVAAAAGVVGGARPAAAAKPTAPHVAVVGAGLSGLRAAHWLWKVKGLRSTVYDANPDRLGGRMWSLRDHFDAGQTVEHGGAFINTDHNALRNLVNSLGLGLYEVGGGNQTYGDVYWADGIYSYAEASQDWSAVWRVFKDALASAPYPQTRAAHTAAGVELDHMTVDEWIDANIPGGTSGRFGAIMRSNSIAEYGLDPSEQSALNLVYLLGWNSQNSLDPINGADERFAVVGGNDQVITRMAAELPAGTIQQGRALVAARRNADGTARLTFRFGNKLTDVVADRVILALPFQVLREVDLSGAGLTAVKLRAIDELGLGANGKIHVQLTRRPWLDQQLGGAAYSPIDMFQCAWDDTVGQPGTGNSSVTSASPGILCYFPGGSRTLDTWTGTDFGPAPSTQVNQFLDWMEPIFPGVRAAYNGRSWRDAWHLNRHSKGAYTCPRPGQYTELFGVPELIEAPFHFAGEHASAEYFGFLNGAVVAGERAAKEVALSVGY